MVGHMSPPRQGHGADPDEDIYMKGVRSHTGSLVYSGARQGFREVLLIMQLQTKISRKGTGHDQHPTNNDESGRNRARWRFARRV